MGALIFDPFAGISGDMMLGALVDLGLPAEWLRDFVAALGIAAVTVDVQRVMRQGIACTQVRFTLPQEHAHRHLRHVLEIIEGAQAGQAAKARAAEAFRRLADAEARIHGTTPDKVHFHEVGALDAILDVLCAMAGIEQLGVTECYTRPVAVGKGWVAMAHGRFPVPAPATLELLRGMALTGHELEGECTTPTGAALLAVLSEGRTPPPGLRVTATGFGAGSRDPQDRPNCLRLIACESSSASDALYLLQTDIDDLAPEYVPPAQEALFQAGALDVTVTAVSMKKGRPGVRLEALVPPDALERVLTSLFRNTPTLGARYWPVVRPALARSEDSVEWRGQHIRRKRVELPGGGQRAKPEYEDVVRAAQALGLTPLEVRIALEAEGATS